MRWQPIYFFLFCCVACNSSVHETGRRQIHLTKDSQAVCISGLEYSILQDLKTDSLTQERWKGIFPVYQMPADTDMKDLQKEQPGTYQINDSTITFKPDTAFKKHQQYFVRFYGNGSAISAWNVIRSKAKLKGPGYTEVVFKF